jgi:hypothetical protein
MAVLVRIVAGFAQVSVADSRPFSLDSPGKGGLEAGESRDFFLCRTYLQSQ